MHQRLPALVLVVLPALLGEVGGFHAVGTGGRFEVTSVDLVRANVGVGGCTNGRHVASSEGPSGVVVWGLDR